MSLASGSVGAGTSMLRVSLKVVLACKRTRPAKSREQFVRDRSLTHRFHSSQHAHDR